MGGLPDNLVLSSTGTVVSLGLDGGIEVSTPVPLVADADNDPATSYATGVRVRVHTGDGSRVTLATDDDTNVTLEVDTDLDGNTDDSIGTTWPDVTS